MKGAAELLTLYRSVGPKELALIEASGWREFPPRLPEQPIFYPVTNEYATQIARDWNVRASGSGFVLLTFDEEFGELVFHRGLSAGGGVDRSIPESPDEVADAAMALLQSQPDLHGTLCFITRDRSPANAPGLHFTWKRSRRPNGGQNLDPQVFCFPWTPRKDDAAVESHVRQHPLSRLWSPCLRASRRG
jgi:hypothetical protein